MNISQKISRRIFILTHLLITVFAGISTLTAQSSSVDSTFNPIISKDVNQFGTAIQPNFTVQPDGKILTYGTFQVVNGVVKTNIVRLNSDGTLDNSFNCTTCDFPTGSAVVQTNGKIIIAGSLSAADNAAAAARLKRLNADGSLDNSFNPASPINGNPVFPNYSGAAVYAVQTDGRILVVVGGSTGGGSYGSLQRFNSDGNSDSTFSPIEVISGRNIRTSPTKIALQSDGKILIALTTTSASGSGSVLRRYNANGSVDATFEPPTIGGTGAFGERTYISDFEVGAEGSVIVVGYFTKVNAIDRINIVKLQSAGNVDLSFAPTNVFQPLEAASGVELLSNGKVLIGTNNRFVRYNPNGEVDTTFVSPAGVFSIIKFVIDSSDSVLVYGAFAENGATVNKFVRLSPDGSIVSSFATNYGTGGTISKLAVQADGKVIIAGDFTQVGGISATNTARLNTDGTLDQTFNTGSGFDSAVEAIVVQPDGKTLIGGRFTMYNGTSKIGFVRLNNDGSLDNSFNSVLEVNAIIYSISLQADGKILIGGQFTVVNGQSRNAVARLNADGSLDASFNPAFGSTIVRRVIQQPDGKILVGGSFSGVNGFNRTNLVRLNADGTLDATFNAGNIAPVAVAELYPNGKYLVYYDGNLIRLNADGTADASFKITSYIINALLVQPDGSVIIAGSFTSAGIVPRSRLARLRADGTVDTTFFPIGANNQINAIANASTSQSGNQIVIGGNFTTVENLTRLGVAKLNISALRAKFTRFDFDGDGRADVSVFRPSNGFWYRLFSQNNAFNAFQFGQAADKIAPADYDGDGRADVAVFRDVVSGAGTQAYFYITYSSDNSFRDIPFGTQGDIPMSGDWDGDGIADLAVYRSATAANGQSYFIYRASSVPNAGFTIIPWGTFGDKPVIGDYDGDGKLDAAVFRPANATWYIVRSSNGQAIVQPFGLSTDVPAPADFDGDGITNFAVFRPSTGYWYTSTNPQTNYGGVQFGAAGDVPVPADYDGDGKADVAVFRPSNGAWYLLRSTAGFTGVQFGTNEDRPIPNAFVK